MHEGGHGFLWHLSARRWAGKRPRPAPPRRRRSRPFPGGRGPPPAAASRAGAGTPAYSPRSSQRPRHGRPRRPGAMAAAEPSPAARRAPRRALSAPGGAPGAGAAAERWEAAAAGPGPLRPAAGGGGGGGGPRGSGPRRDPAGKSRSWRAGLASTCRPGRGGRRCTSDAARSAERGGFAREEAVPNVSRTLPEGPHAPAATSVVARMLLKCWPNKRTTCLTGAARLDRASQCQTGHLLSFALWVTPLYLGGSTLQKTKATPVHPPRPRCKHWGF